MQFLMVCPTIVIRGPEFADFCFIQYGRLWKVQSPWKFSGWALMDLQPPSVCAQVQRFDRNQPFKHLLDKIVDVSVMATFK